MARDPGTVAGRGVARPGLAATSFGCFPAQDKHGLSWIGSNEGNNDMRLIGVAWNAVAEIDLVWDHGRVPVKWAGDLFWVDWRVPVSLDMSKRLHARFVVTYRDLRPAATVPVS